MLLLIASGPALADRNDFAVDYYTIQGETSSALGAEIAAKGPVGENGKRSDGYTRWSMRWTFNMTADATGCLADRVTVDVDIRMTLPRWNTPPGANPQLIARWNRYLAALRTHEDGHRYRSEEVAWDMRRALFRERAPDCRTLESHLNSIANGMLAQLRERQAAYDRETNFGQKQGVRRP